MAVHNLQNDSESELLSEIEGILNRSRAEWLDYGDVAEVIALANHLIASTEMVENFVEGLFLYPVEDPTDAYDWDFVEDRVTAQAPPLCTSITTFVFISATVKDCDTVSRILR
ncbi:unnamed protein product [Arabis nemorensis]|uniref:Uncharacterized protein n=1 Tax=Arabis nemorensis TaxID=586526 RepID=A0A565BQT4_9BRAS|nr:unnamed protein product [Arabis nemorensis]